MRFDLASLKSGYLVPLEMETHSVDVDVSLWKTDFANLLMGNEEKSFAGDYYRSLLNRPRIMSAQENITLQLAHSECCQKCGVVNESGFFDNCCVELAVSFAEPNIAIVCYVS